MDQFDAPRRVSQSIRRKISSMARPSKEKGRRFLAKLVRAPVRSIWWCNQSRDWYLERGEGVVCSTDQMENVTYRKTVGGAHRGDIVVHYCRPFVVAFSCAQEDARYYEELPLVSGEDYGSGWRFRTEYFDLESPLHRDLFANDLVPLIVKHYPVDRNGHLRQGYFFPFNLAGLRVVLKNVTEREPKWLSRLRS